MPFVPYNAMNEYDLTLAFQNNASHSLQISTAALASVTRNTASYSWVEKINGT